MIFGMISVVSWFVIFSFVFRFLPYSLAHTRVVIQFLAVIEESTNSMTVVMRAGGTTLPAGVFLIDSRCVMSWFSEFILFNLSVRLA